MVKKYPYQHFDPTDMKGEDWEDIPLLDGAYQISNYGRVKSLRRWVEIYGGRGYWIKGKILKTLVFTQIVSGGKRKLQRLAIAVNYEGSKYRVSVARMVYYLFVKKFKLEDRTLSVSCNDENPFNIQPNNLFLTSPSQNITKAYRLNRRPRESFDNKSFQVSQYDLQGKWIATYDSINEAARRTHIGPGKISVALTRPNKYCGNSLWRSGNNKKDLTNIPFYVKKKLASDLLYATVISQYDLSGRKLREYANLKTASKAMKCKPSSIRLVLLNKTLTTKGYYWRLGRGATWITMGHLQESKRNWEKKICRTISQYGPDGQRIGSYVSQAEAARQLNISPMAINGALRSKTKNTAGGYFWQYEPAPACIEVPEKLKRRYALRKI